ncbi:hypothetical protein BGZ60DRAFT_526632 [Tricladium varicosporioides]|nr:hypothetical protein BGZ60DRAFT_526632 [Hymenoscyphus varicosporioides]
MDSLCGIQQLPALMQQRLDTLATLDQNDLVISHPLTSVFGPRVESTDSNNIHRALAHTMADEGDQGITTVESSLRTTDWEARQARINATIDRAQVILNAPIPPHLRIPGQTPRYSHLCATPFESREDTGTLLSRRASDLAKLELRVNRIAAEDDGGDILFDYGLSAARTEAEKLVKKCEDLKEELWGPSPYKIVQGTTTPNSSVHITNLPAEIHLKILDLLDSDSTSSACLGITCKKFYPMFLSRHLRAPLTAYADCKPTCPLKPHKVTGHGFLPGTHCKSKPLFILLLDFMPSHLTYSAYAKKYTTLEHERELKDELRRKRKKMPVYMHLSCYWDLLFQEQTVCMIKGFENERRLKWGVSLKDVEIVSASRLTTRFWPSGEEESESGDEDENEDTILGEVEVASSRGRLWGTVPKATKTWKKVKAWFGGSDDEKTKLIRVKRIDP